METDIMGNAGNIEIKCVLEGTCERKWCIGEEGICPSFRLKILSELNLVDLSGPKRDIKSRNELEDFKL